MTWPYAVARVALTQILPPSRWSMRAGTVRARRACGLLELIEAARIYYSTKLPSVARAISVGSTGSGERAEFAQDAREGLYLVLGKCGEAELELGEASQDRV